MTHLGIHDSETTADGLFTLQEVECLGACANAPMMQVNGEWVYEDLTAEKAIAVVEMFRRGEQPFKVMLYIFINARDPKMAETIAKDP